MMRSKWLLSLLLLAVAGALWFWLGRASAPPTMIAPIGEETARPNEPVPAAVTKFREGKPLERVKLIYEEEGKRIGAVDPDPDLTQRRLELIARELHPSEIDWLKQEALRRDEMGDARFFATYLLALNGQEAAVGALREISLSPVPESKNPGLVELERQIRAQAVEGLSRVRGKDVARDALLDIVNGQADEFLRDRAHRGLYAWQTGKSIEDQDKEGLEKLLYEGREKGKRGEK
jgi:hypothetical protein